MLLLMMVTIIKEASFNLNSILVFSYSFYLFALVSIEHVESDRQQKSQQDEQRNTTLGFLDRIHGTRLVEACRDDTARVRSEPDASDDEVVGSDAHRFGNEREESIKISLNG